MWIAVTISKAAKEHYKLALIVKSQNSYATIHTNTNSPLPLPDEDDTSYEESSSTSQP